MMIKELIYNERLSSNKTQALFLTLFILPFSLAVWRVSSGGWDALAVILLCVGLVFLFYVVNYRTLVIQLTSESLRLKFGLFTWKVPLENMAEFRLDDVPALMRLGGAGIHFMFVRSRYRASFNFLEYPRVVVSFKRRVGPVRDISFSTSRPDELLRRLQDQTQGGR